MFLFYHFHQSNKNSLNEMRPVQSTVPLISFVPTQNKIRVESNWRKKSYLIYKYFKTARNNNKGKFEKNRCAYCLEIRARNDFHFRLRAYEYFLCHVFYVIPKKTGVALERTFYLHCFADRFNLCFITKWQQKLSSFFFTQKRMTVELFQHFLSPFIQKWSVIVLNNVSALQL